MLFGIPWYALIPMIAIVGGLVYAYKEKELEMESKRVTNVSELNELRKVVHNLKSRIDILESDLKKQSKQSSYKASNSLGDIEIDDEVKDQNSDNSAHNQGNTKTRN
jgi:hypothetical protein